MEQLLISAHDRRARVALADASPSRCRDERALAGCSSPPCQCGPCVHDRGGMGPQVESSAHGQVAATIFIDATSNVLWAPPGCGGFACGSRSGRAAVSAALRVLEVPGDLDLVAHVWLQLDRRPGRQRVARPGLRGRRFAADGGHTRRRLDRLERVGRACRAPRSGSAPRAGIR